MKKKIDPYLLFQLENKKRISSYQKNTKWKNLSKRWLIESVKNNYMYNFEWLGRPIIQMPTDIAVIQELVWKIKPDLIIETGIAHGGSLVLSASILGLLDMCEAIESNSVFNPKKSKRKVLGIDIDIRKHNKKAILKHPMSSRIKMIEGSSVSKNVINKVRKFSQNYKKIMVFLDSNHTHNHVKEELNAYASLTSLNSYCIVFDTIVEYMPKNFYSNRPWNKGDNPMTAVNDYLKEHDEFKIDKIINDKIMLSQSPNGFLKKIK